MRTFFYCFLLERKISVGGRRSGGDILLLSLLRLLGLELSGGSSSGLGFLLLLTLLQHPRVDQLGAVLNNLADQTWK